jgi:hypothetical protein
LIKSLGGTLLLLLLPSPSSATTPRLGRFFCRYGMHASRGDTHWDKSIADLTHNDAPVCSPVYGRPHGRKFGFPVWSDLIYDMMSNEVGVYKG